MKQLTDAVMDRSLRHCTENLYKPEWPLDLARTSRSATNADLAGFTGDVTGHSVFVLEAEVVFFSGISVDVD